LEEEKSMTGEPYYKYFIRSEWYGRVETPVAIGAKFLATLDALSDIDPIFKNWLLADFPNPSSGDSDIDGWNIKAIPIASARPRIAEIVENYVVRDDFNEPRPDDGYTGIATTREIGGPRVASVTLNAGGRREGDVWLEFGDNPAPDLTIVTYPLFKAALLAINAVWRAPWDCAVAFRPGAISVPGVEIVSGMIGTRIVSVESVPLDPTFPYSLIHIPWIAYLSPEYAADIALPGDILTERTPGGGLLMSATTERLDPDNPEHVRRARMIAEVMIARIGLERPRASLSISHPKYLMRVSSCAQSRWEIGHL
jgi:hypothetical protein